MVPLRARPAVGATFDSFAAARNRFDAVRGAAAPALYASSPAFNAEPAAPTGTAAPVPVKVENLGDAPLNITAVTIGNQAGEPTGAQGSATDFTITSQTCTTGPIAAATGSNPASSCTVFVRFNPRRALTTSIARLQFTSDSDAATNVIHAGRHERRVDRGPDRASAAPSTASSRWTSPARSASARSRRHRA